MKFPISWIESFINTPLDAKEFAEKMTMSGTMVEGISTQGADISNVVVGKIESIDAHPDAEKLVVCQVNVGDSVVQIVTGASNVKVGDYVPVALDNSNLPGGVVIKKGKLRGVESNGMMCSTDELNLTPKGEATGIMILNGEHEGLVSIPHAVEVGRDIHDCLGLCEVIAEVELTANRPDCQSIIAIAKEAAATFNAPFTMEQPKFVANDKNIDDYIQISVAEGRAQDICKRYTARVVENVKIEPSPKWLADRLELSGIRSINNIVDITNYICLEYGQPLHAFDYSKIGGSQVNIRMAQQGESLVTLDGIERALTTDDLVIADDSKPMVIAGVMGGENSGIDENTSTILFECANFEQTSVRWTAKRVGLRTESSVRYAKGIDENIARIALDRACELVNILKCGDIIGGTVDIYKSLAEPKKIPFDSDEINRLLGTDITKEQMIEILNKVDIKIDGDKAIIPTIRRDIAMSWGDKDSDQKVAEFEAMADLSEEIARFYGYNNIPSTSIRGVSNGMLTRRQVLANLTNSTLTACGYNEIMTYSFIDPADYAKAALDLPNVLTLKKPLGQEHSIMRTQAVTSMLYCLSVNYNNSNKSALMYEMAKVYIPSNDKEHDLPDEKLRLVLGAYGDNVDFFTLKGTIESYLDALGVKPYEFKPIDLNQSGNDVYHKYQAAQLIVRGRTIGIIGRVSPLIAANFGLKCDVYLADIDYDAAIAAANLNKTHTPLPKYPKTERDIALIVDDDVLVGDIEKAMRSAKVNILESIALFDVYCGEQVAAGKKSVAYTLTFRAKDKTLTEDEVALELDKILTKVREKCKAEMRE
ncbi:MAG: phenylalanine--tRNA ligase subunit beta [Clostridiales bacterium]|jgi:phenylalanyl-tRNA synthetase beta chain|nr:phenylalanine--tRNA ligase subunit beta [Clostridiales bacterium]